MSKLVRWLIICTLAMVGALAFDAHQQAWADKSEPAGVDQARRLMDEGQSLFKQGRYRDAMEKFEAAYRAHAAGAFLYNAAFAAEKAGDRQRAIARYNEYLASDLDSPYADQVREKVSKLQEELTKVPEPTAAPDAGGGGGGGGEASAGGGGAGGGTDAAPVPADEEAMAEIRSLVRIISEPAGAPMAVYERVIATASPYRFGAENTGWKKIIGGVQTPKDLSLKVGHYHVVIDSFRDFNRNETDINLDPGHVYTFKAALSQGEFLGQLLFKTNIEHAKVFVDDPPPHKSAPMFRGPGSVNLNKGPHEVWVEAPGYKPVHESVDIKQGETVELSIQLERLDYGYLVLDGNAGEIEVEIDGTPHPLYHSRGDPLRIKLPAGKHSVVLDASGRKEFEGDIDVPKGQDQPVHANLVDSYPRGKAVVLGVFAVGAAVAGVVLHLEYEKPEGDPHDADMRQAFNISRFGAWGASGLLAGLSIFYAFYDPFPDSFVRTDPPREVPETESQEAPQAATDGKDSALVEPYVAPWFGPGVGGLSVGGTF